MMEIMSEGYETTKYVCGCNDKGAKVDGEFVGKIERKWCDGTVYEGEYNEHYSSRYPNSELGCNGYGRFTFSNGDWHEGLYVDNLANGKGVFYYSSKDIYWIGSFIDNIPEGVGTYFRKNSITEETHNLYKGEGLIRLMLESPAPSSDKCSRVKQNQVIWENWEYWIEEGAE